MANLAVANILHHKLRSALSVLGIGVGICMLVTLTGLARGSLFEVADRMESVDADLVLVPPGLAGKTPTLSGVALREGLAEALQEQMPDRIRRAVPAFIASMKLGGQDQRVTAIHPDDWDVMTGGAELTEGRLFDPQGQFGAWLEDRLLRPGQEETLLPSRLAERYAQQHPDAHGLELVIDSRLARAGGYRVGQDIRAANRTWRIVGIVPEGVTTRVFMPLRTAQYLFGFGDLKKCTFVFAQLQPQAAAGPTGRVVQERFGVDAAPMSSYRATLAENFGILLVYVNIVNVIALVIAFLFVMIILYTMVLQRTRDIAILKSCGASRGFILRQVLAEAVLLAAGGTVAGLAMSFPAAWAIEAYRPLLTVRFTWTWTAVALAAACGGSLLSGLYPAWRASRVNVLEALSME